MVYFCMCACMFVCVCLCVRACMFVCPPQQATGRFEGNVFVLMPGQPKTIQFVPFSGQAVDMKLLETSVRVDHLGLYLSS